MNLRSFNLFRDYSNPLSLPNVGEFLRNNSKQTQVIMRICMFISFFSLRSARPRLHVLPPESVRFRIRLTPFFSLLKLIRLHKRKLPRK